MPPDETELIVNLRNHRRAEQPLSENARTVRTAAVLDASLLEAQRRDAALVRLKLRALELQALGDETLADLLTVLGLTT